MENNINFKIGQKVFDLSNIEGTVIESPYAPALIRVSFDRKGGDWRDLNPHQLTTKIMENNILNKRNWRTGYFIQSSKTAHWPQRQIDLTNEDENKIVFANFKEEDKGRSRKRICTCENKEDAAFICKAVNNYDSLLEEKEYALSEGKRLSEVATHWKTEYDKFKEQNNSLLEALKRIADTYDNVEDLAGVVARKAIDNINKN